MNAAYMAPAITLFNQDGTLDFESQEKLFDNLIEKGVEGQELCDVIAEAQEARKDGTQVLVARMNKNKKFQKEQLIAQGYEEFKEFYKEALKG